MTVVVNGIPRDVPAGTTVEELVAGATPPGQAAHVAVARNGEVVTRSAWGTTVLADGDRCELLAAAQGG